MTGKSYSVSTEMRCVWCGLKKLGKPKCLCDDPKYEKMEQCGDCGLWRPVDNLTVEPDDPHETPICP